MKKQSLVLFILLAVGGMLPLNAGKDDKKIAAQKAALAKAQADGRTGIRTKPSLAAQLIAKAGVGQPIPVPSTNLAQVAQAKQAQGNLAEAKKKYVLAVKNLDGAARVTTLDSSLREILKLVDAKQTSFKNPDDEKLFWYLLRYCVHGYEAKKPYNRAVGNWYLSTYKSLLKFVDDKNAAPIATWKNDLAETIDPSDLNLIGILTHEETLKALESSEIQKTLVLKKLSDEAMLDLKWL